MEYLYVRLWKQIFKFSISLLKVFFEKKSV